MRRETIESYAAFSAQIWMNDLCWYGLKQKCLTWLRIGRLIVEGGSFVLAKSYTMKIACFILLRNQIRERILVRIFSPSSLPTSEGKSAEERRRPTLRCMLGPPE